MHKFTQTVGQKKVVRGTLFSNNQYSSNVEKSIMVIDIDRKRNPK